MTTITERVAAGAAFLDEHRPHWAESIRLADLDLGNYGRCVLGQLYGSYGRGADYLKLFDGATIDLGFTASGDDAEHSVTPDTSEYPPLTAEWARVITERRSQP